MRFLTKRKLLATFNILQSEKDCYRKMRFCYELQFVKAMDGHKIVIL